jgi:hypothetical protein
MDKLIIRRLRILGVAAISIFGTFFGMAHAQTAKDLVGTWQVVSNVNSAADGKKIHSFGPNPKGMAIFSSDGHYMITLLRDDLPKLASNNRLQATAEENAAIARGSIASYGTYSIADKVLTLKVVESTYPNWRGVEQIRDMLVFTNDDLTLGFDSPMGGHSEIVWKRVK